MPVPVPRSRIAAYALMAALALLLGSQLRPATPAAAPAPNVDASTLERLTARNALQGHARFLSERAYASSRSAVWLPQAGSSGILWNAGGTVVAPGPAGALVQAYVLTSPTTPPPKAGPSNSPTEAPAWLVAVVRKADGGLLWTAGMRAGRRTSACEGFVYEELITSFAPDPAFAGAGVFDLDGALHGLVTQCAERLTILPVAEVDRALAFYSSTPERLALEIGLRPGDPVPAGLQVLEVRLDTPAHHAGISPGDVLMSVDGQPLARPEDLDPLLNSGEHRVNILHENRPRAISLSTSSSSPAGAGWTLDSPGITLSSVAPGSRADRAGLRPGDRILRLGSQPVSAEDALDRLLARAGNAPLPLVYRRHRLERITTLPQ